MWWWGYVWVWCSTRVYSCIRLCFRVQTPEKDSINSLLLLSSLFFRKGLSLKLKLDISLRRVVQQVPGIYLSLPYNPGVTDMKTQALLSHRCWRYKLMSSFDRKHSYSISRLPQLMCFLFLI